MSISGSGLNEPPGVNTAAFALAVQRIGNLLSPLALSRYECDNAGCIERLHQRGQAHGAFVYELVWGMAQTDAGLLVPAVRLTARCKQCGTNHTRIEVPHLMGVPPPIVTLVSGGGTMS